MTSRSIFDIAILSAAFLAIIHSSAAAGDAGEDAFSSKCAGCHTIGGGKLVGPDLVDTKNWSEADIEKEVRRMSAQAGALSDGDVGAIVGYLKAGGAKQSKNLSEDPSGQCPAPANVKQASTMDAAIKATSGTGSAMSGSGEQERLASALEGEQLFMGEKQFANRGMACAACHSVNGSHATMGPDLKDIAKKMNEDGLIFACEKTPFKVMKTAYAKNPVMHEEARSLARYLTELKDRAATQSEPFTVYGAAGAAGILGLVFLSYINRKGPARDRLKRKS